MNIPILCKVAKICYSFAMERMNLKQACEYLCISEATGRNWIRQGRIFPAGYGDRQQAYFDAKELETLKDQLSASGKLTSRRNKTADTSYCIYEDYLDCSKETSEQLLKIIQYHAGRSIPLLSVIAHYAESFFRQQNTLETYGVLVDELLALMSAKEKERCTDMENYPALTFQPYTDLLGYLYISLMQLDRRKKAGIYYTPSVLVKRLTKQCPSNGCSYFDPSCGTGNFLLQLLAQNDPAKCELYGQDTDPAAIAIARINIALNHPTISLSTLHERIRTADSLKLFPDCPDMTILGNPPWGATHPENYGKEDSAALFVKKALLNQSEKGIISFLLPESLLTAKKHAAMRKLILEQAQIISVVYLEQSFRTVNCPAIILSLQKNTENPGIVHCRIEKKEDSYTIQNRKLPASFQSVCPFMLHADEEAYALFCKINSLENSVTLKGAADFALGIVTGDNKRFLLPAGQSSSEASAYSESPLTASKPSEPVIRGFNLSKYQIHGPFDHILYQPKLFQQCAPECYYRAEEKLLYRFIGKTPVFAYDNHGYLTLNSCNILIPRIEGLDLRYLLAVLNSSVAAFYWRTGFSSVKLLRSHIEALPIPLISHEAQKPMITLVDNLLTKGENHAIIEKLDKMISGLYHLTDEELSVIQKGIFS